MGLLTSSPSPPLLHFFLTAIDLLACQSACCTESGESEKEKSHLGESEGDLLDRRLACERGGDVLGRLSATGERLPRRGGDGLDWPFFTCRPLARSTARPPASHGAAEAELGEPGVLLCVDRACAVGSCRWFDDCVWMRATMCSPPTPSILIGSPALYRMSQDLLVSPQSP